MKRITFLSCFIFSFSVNANNIIVNGTRFIYPENEKEITVQLSNTAERPALAQVWLDNGNPDATPDTISTPFIISPPISRIDAKSGQTLRIKLASNMTFAKNKETLLWLNLLEIPPVERNIKNTEQNILQLALRSRFKFIYRPNGLGNRDRAVEQLALSVNGKNLSIKNPTPFYVTVSRISRGDGNTLNKKTMMLAPQSSQIVILYSEVSKDETLTINNINDYGADVAVRITVK